MKPKFWQQMDESVSANYPGNLAVEHCTLLTQTILAKAEGYKVIFLFAWFYCLFVCFRAIKNGDASMSIHYKGLALYS